jgi:hypothetical protein
MQYKTILSIIAGVILAACGDSVPTITDPDNIVVDGKSMTQREFVDQYCRKKTDNENCVLVRRAMVTGSTKSKNGTLRF